MYVPIPTTRYRHRRGMGQVTGAQRTAGVVGEVGAIGTPVATGAIAGSLATPAATAGGAATIFGLSTAVAVPIIGAALAGLTLAITKLIASSGCGPTCIKSTDYANQAGDLMAKNLSAYLSLPAPRAASAQQTALSNFDQLWAQLVNLCTNDPQLRGTTAGRNCIADRQAGACKWKASPGGWTRDSSGSWTYKGWGPAGSGSDCWNWFIGLRDPIANDPAVAPDSQAAAPSVLSSLGVATGGGTSLLPLVVIAGLIAVGVYLS